jgi:hypothetical protein
LSIAGAEVSFIVRSDFLREEDYEIREEFKSVFMRNHEVHKGYAPFAVSYNDGEFAVSCRYDAGSQGTIVITLDT